MGCKSSRRERTKCEVPAFLIWPDVADPIPIPVDLAPGGTLLFRGLSKARLRAFSPSHRTALADITADVRRLGPTPVLLVRRHDECPLTRAVFRLSRRFDLIHQITDPKGEAFVVEVIGVLTRLHVLMQDSERDTGEREFAACVYLLVARLGLESALSSSVESAWPDLLRQGLDELAPRALRLPPVLGVAARALADPLLSVSDRTKLGAEVEAYGCALHPGSAGQSVDLAPEGTVVASGHGVRLRESGRIETDSGVHVLRISDSPETLALAAALIEASEPIVGAKNLVRALHARDPDAWPFGSDSSARALYRKLKVKLRGSTAALLEKRGHYGLWNRNDETRSQR